MKESCEIAVTGFSSIFITYHAVTPPSGQKIEKKNYAR
jgi:hypothetical protein